MASDSLGDRMKDQYENRTRIMLPRRTYTVIRVDGKAFRATVRSRTMRRSRGRWISRRRRCAKKRRARASPSSSLTRFPSY